MTAAGDEARAAGLAAGHLAEPVVRHARADWVAFRPGQSAASAIESLRNASRLPEKIVYFYVTDDEGRLRGVVPTRRLLSAPASAPISSLMVADVVSLSSDDTVEAAAEAFLRHRFLALPVVDASGRIVGVADIGLFAEEMAALVERDTRQDVFQLIGVHLEEARASGPWGDFRRRFPWLLCNVAGGLLCAWVAARHEALIEGAVFLALFVPIVLALAESVSIQAMTLTLQALHARAGGAGRSLVRAVGRELGAALLLGMACGTTVGALVWAWGGAVAPALTVGLGIALSMVSACLLGALLPRAVRALRLDPRIAAGPIVLATADVATLLLYFTVAGRLLRP
jgi:magnesium transporter